MTYYKKLLGEKCYLSPPCAEDAETWTEWFNDLAITLPLGDEAYAPYSLEKQKQVLNDMITNQSHVFVIVDLETDHPIGRCLLFGLDHVNRCAMLGIAIGEKSYWGQGYGQEAIRLLLDYAFNLLNLNNVMLGAFSFNQRAIACYRKVGFKEIGRRREARIIGSQAYDVVLMDMLAAEFEPGFIADQMAQAGATDG